MSHIVIIGCGVVGATIAYQLSKIEGLKITVLDKQMPAQGSTGAALGVLMGVISQKAKGRPWKMRRMSVQAYHNLIPELEAKINRSISHNRQGILQLCLPGEDLDKWQRLINIREADDLPLEMWDVERLGDRCPQLQISEVIAGIYSPEDLQVNPVELTLALVEAAQQNGVNFHFGVTVAEYKTISLPRNEYRCRQVSIKNLDETKKTPTLPDVDWLVVAAGLGSLPCLQGIKGGKLRSLQLKRKSNVDNRFTLIPVLGQALHLQVSTLLGKSDFQPVITGDDVHIIPVAENEYWVGATVEFPNDIGEVVADSSLLDHVMARAISFCPGLADATILRKWSGLRPRPEGQAAPAVGYLEGWQNILLATGHYRNGVLLAPATAEAVEKMIVK
ncbi:MAG: FAD-dependent oxidoreductase [Trichodesmium sp. St16_bin4-tuft]|nr:FAD-dependent oxidoreductase [Trichodesmium sp. St5_bin8]MDE5092015.1 FAD-dependent oxidoreductase [Trichodesmium sp. St18_bin3_1_1]MDE5100350.1 FAD-dependent oxidoreductase [Trichodesmium sp. St16_bin4-tuft]MDE5105354.1 FAD-dependent oxidoreductase [Trichodesmium sp. St19_bin2]